MRGHAPAGSPPVGSAGPGQGGLGIGGCRPGWCTGIVWWSQGRGPAATPPVWKSGVCGAGGRMSRVVPLDSPRWPAPQRAWSWTSHRREQCMLEQSKGDSLLKMLSGQIQFIKHDTTG